MSGQWTKETTKESVVGVDLHENGSQLRSVSREGFEEITAEEQDLA